MLKHLLALVLLPITLICEIWGTFLVLFGIFELRIQMYFRDDLFDASYHQSTVLHKCLFAVPFFLLTLIEVAVLVPLYLCHRIINTIMEVIPLIMVIPSFIVGTVLGLFLFIFNHAQYYLLDPLKKMYCKPGDFSEVHPTAVMSQKMSRA